MTNPRTLFLSLTLAAVVASNAPAQAQNHVEGTLTVAGKAMKITQVYAFAQKGFFDPKKQDIVLLMCDGAVPPAGVRDHFERKALVDAGSLHCVEQTIDASKQVINFKVEDKRFGMPESGGSTEQVFEAQTFDGKTIAGKAHTKGQQMSFKDVPYTYDITVHAAIEPMK